jgi:small subunit ribosomal protein S12
LNFNLKKKLNFLSIKKKKRVSNKLSFDSHRKGLITSVVIKTPKKPNSALRHVARTAIYKNSKIVFGRIPGIGLLPTKYNRVLLRGGRANDVPSVMLTLIRGVYDFSGLVNKKKRRSIYGADRPENYTSHIRRRFRQIYS